VKTSVRTLAPACVALALVLAACSSGSAASSGPTGAPAASSSTPPSGTTQPASTAAPSTTAPSTPSTGGSSTSASAIPPESPVPPEDNPPGDIPDDTKFVLFRSASGHFEIRFPEGWSRRTVKDSVSFTDKLNTVTVTWGPSSTKPTVGSVKAHELPELRQTERAFSFESAQQVSLPGGAAVELMFQANSEPNQVTGKQYRLDVLRFDLFKNGVEAHLDLSSPVGADNVDPWRIISESFRWR
jgi:hypothetical protein